MSRINPIVLLVIVILAIAFFLLGLLQLVIRCVMKRPSFSSLSQSNRLPDATSAAPHTFQRQLQHLFRLHDSGLDQSLIDNLPLFYYKDIVGLKEPFDCAVCLSEFSFFDKLKFLPNCSHAFHIHCIETWLLSNSTCPLCRSLIGLANHVENENSLLNYDMAHVDRWANADSTSNAAPARTFSIRLGKFRSTNGGVDSETKMQNEVTTTSSSSIDGRRCYSMGEFEYVVGEVELQVALINGNGNGIVKKGRERREQDSDNAEGDGKSIRSRGESFSVSKIWLWSKKGKFLNSNENVVVSIPSRTDLV